MNNYKITGWDAVRIGERDGLTIHCHANPIDDGGVVTAGVAEQIAKEDPSLIFIGVTPTGNWRDASDELVDPEGRNAHQYFTTSGMYLGPDDDGVEPEFADGSTVRVWEEWVNSHTDDDVLDEGELERAFAALAGRKPTDKDRAEGLWSHVCQLVS